jgi:hypothetical protein
VSLVVSLFGAALLVHELLYVTRDGGEYLRRCFVPTLGLQLSTHMHCTLHLTFMSACVWMTLWPSSRPAHLVVFLFLSLVIASYSLRVSNHLVLGWAALVVILASDGAVLLGAAPAESGALLILGVQGLTILTYVLAFAHKLNSDFVSVPDSYASQFAAFVCWDRGVPWPWFVRLLQWYSVVSTLIIEFTLPVLLLVPQTRPIGLLVAVAFHFSLALLGIVNFSAVMYAGLAAFLPLADQATWPAHTQVWTAGTVVTYGLAVAMVWLVTPRRANWNLPYHHRRAAWIIQTWFGLLTGWFATQAFQFLGQPSSADGRYGFGDLGATWPVLALVLVCYLANGLAPYVGVKTEFSMAMFSNLRCKGWNHLVFPARWRVFDGAHYIVVDRVEGLPDVAEVGHDGASELAHAVLARPNDFQYAPYFFFEALQRLCDATRRPAHVTVDLHFRGRAYRVTAGATATASSLRPAGFPAWPRANLFPFVLPLSPRASHSEQGTVLSADRHHQLF